ncbi:penicillin acylase family protein [Cytobacillus oceanisediminis]|nr:penicillin acylase family protein [Cytobacillus oceanisediminis]
MPLSGAGRSGHPLSRWYHDQMNDWAEGNYHQTRLNEQSSKNQLALNP